MCLASHVDIYTNTLCSLKFSSGSILNDKIMKMIKLIPLKFLCIKKIYFSILKDKNRC